MATILTPTQTGRPMVVRTPLGPDALLLVGFTGTERMSQLFKYELDLVATNFTDISFDRLLAQKVSVSLDLPTGEQRHFSGICSRISQGNQDATFTAYRMEVVPQFWLLTKKTQSRIFQHLSVPDILKEVLKGLDVAFEIQGTFSRRNFCVQYNETDFDFVSRLMEEEGIFYFFKHTGDAHKMVIANTPQSLPDAEPGTITYETMAGGKRNEDRIFQWEKSQELRSGKITLWDHSFELPHKHLEVEKLIAEKVKVGKVDHKLKIGGNENLEVYDYPGEYAQRFDGINKGGGEQAAELQKIFQDNARTAGIRMQEETVPSIVIQGSSNCRQLVAGHKFTLQRHFNADGKYLLTGVQHSATASAQFRAGDAGGFEYSNQFTCIPADMVFRPPRLIEKPRVKGSQTAVVVGPPGEEIFTDKYSRVKVQFHWDRDGKNDADSSCWLRVATVWAGKQWGIIHIPRIGQEVVVDFLEGDPDRPIIVGSVFNPEMMPPYALPANKTQSGIKTRSSIGGGPANCNEIRFEDKKGEEQLVVHAEKDSLIETEHDRTEWVGNDESIKIDGKQTEKIAKERSIDVGTDDSLKVAKTIVVDAGDQITLKTGAAQIVMKKDGTIEIKGIDIKVSGTKSIENKGALITSEASAVHTIKGSLVKIN